MKTLLSLLCLLYILPLQARAQDNFDYTAFSQIPVQHEGRVKPLDSFSRSFLHAFHGRDSLGSIDANAWLAETLFDPAHALRRPLFRVFRPDSVGLPVRGEKYYSYEELAAALSQKSDAISALAQTDEKNWSVDQRELMRLYEASVLYTQLLRSLTFVLPLNITMPTSLAKELKIAEEKPFTLKDYARYEDKVEQRLKSIIRKKGDNPANYSDEEKSIATFAFNMQALKTSGENNILLRLAPGQSQDAGGAWFSPWALMNSGEGSPQSAIYLRHWQDMAQAYQNNDPVLWKTASGGAYETAKSFANPTTLRLETLYNGWHPPTVALVLYFAAFMAFIGWSMKNTPFWRKAALTVLGAGCVMHIAAIAMRVIILERPPVGTLYESILFVAMICAVVSFFLELRRKDGTGLLTGSLSGMLLLFTAQSFAEDDTMKMLVAVLNTNFWLATHVLCITIGYGWCLLASLIAHLWLFRRACGRDAGSLAAPVKTLALVALLFTAVGTILGGIWADQSWGRFWGWDPKENGALLIVLWLIWLLHAQISGHLKRPYFMSGMAALSVIVALAWFGVNLLNVGLHSYGFITGVAAGLAAFCALEGALIGFLVYRTKPHAAQ